MSNLTRSGSLHDELGLGNDPSIIKLLRPKERIILSAKVYKYNMKLKRQERSLLITTKAIYNIKQDLFVSLFSVFSSSLKIRRKIDITKVAGITASNFSSEFVIHVADEYDYRFASPQRRDAILLAIFHAYYSSAPDVKPLLIFFKEDINLIKFTTTQQDKKNGFNRFPKDTPLKVNEAELREILMEKKQKTEIIKENTKLVFNKSDRTQEVSLADFDIIRVLGRGTFGKVMLVEKKDTKRIYAMKSMHKEDLIDKEQIERIKAEKFILANNKSPFLVSLEFAFHTPEKLFFVMNFMQGGELFEHLRNSRRFDEARAKFYAAEVILALEYIHGLGAIYRDLKPENILMDHEGHLALTDFGMAKCMKEGELTKSMVGTPDYLAPEIVLDQGHGPAVDWWSVGILTFEMMFGVPPFYNKEQNLRQIYSDIINKNIDFGTKIKISPEAKSFISQLLTRNPKERLGAGGAEEVKAHKWFKDIDWEKLSAKKVIAPFKPKISDEWDVRNFSSEFTSEDAKNSMVINPNRNLLNKFNKDFDDLIYRNPDQLTQS